MFWGLAPSVISECRLPSQTPMEPVISRELLRAVCEPFFEQMLTALQQALQETQKSQNEEARTLQSMNQKIKSAYVNPVSCPSERVSNQLDTMLDEESTEADELGAFASLLSGPSSEEESVDAVEMEMPATEVVTPLVPCQTSHENSKRTNEPTKSTMVCRHWKSKGWCRLQSNCKFLHPEEKRGVGACHKSCSAGGADSGPGGINRDARPVMSILSLSDALSTGAEVSQSLLARDQRKGSMEKSGNEEEDQRDLLDKTSTGKQSSHCPKEYQVSKSLNAPIV